MEEFRRQLIEKRDEILNEADKTLSEMTVQSAYIPETNERATVESGRRFELRIHDREQKLLLKIEEALERVEDGKYGVCESCGRNIGEKRLEARPVTTFCIVCKTIQEKREKIQGE